MQQQQDARPDDETVFFGFTQLSTMASDLLCNDSMATDHRKLDAFNLADELTVRMYRNTASFPGSERYGLRSQLRRASVSIATNIVEGCARDSDREHARFFEIAFGSAREVTYLIELSTRLEFLESTPAAELHELARRTAAALAALRRSLRP